MSERSYERERKKRERERNTDSIQFEDTYQIRKYLKKMEDQEREKLKRMLIERKVRENTVGRKDREEERSDRTE